MAISSPIEWSQLLEKGQKNSLETIESLRENQEVAKTVRSWLSFCAQKLPGSVVFEVLNRSTFREILDIWADQAGKDLFARTSKNETPKIDRPFKTLSSFQRKHNQLLCTEESLLRRFEHVQRVCSPEDKILVVGDDDQLSLLLHSHHFLNVTMIDIDPRIVAEIKKATQGGVRSYVHDLSHSPPPELVDDYKLIVMDPPYSLKGIQLFVSGAKRFLRGQNSRHLQLYCASVCLGPSGLIDMQTFMKDQSYLLTEFESAACQYPYSPLARVGFIVLYAVASLRLGLYRDHFRSSLIPESVFSDLWEFTNQP